MVATEPLQRSGRSVVEDNAEYEAALLHMQMQPISPGNGGAMESNAASTSSSDEYPNTDKPVTKRRCGDKQSNLLTGILLVQFAQLAMIVLIIYAGVSVINTVAPQQQRFDQIMKNAVAMSDSPIQYVMGPDAYSNATITASKAHEFMRLFLDQLLGPDSTAVTDLPQLLANLRDSSDMLTEMTHALNKHKERRKKRASLTPAATTISSNDGDAGDN
jgi:hypothetical protein